ncbi:LOW QUALITY PROTEIN: uncharacterized protein LOC124289014 [Haliotis rubra]|uniref:LOW QUALITY PROTEIN: uncharacterized protein LOC124289014 n=1 Tax=Haliotis rubra TaxID=36100 RepID=UPI001EE5E609|nr:LOW QUALITY PROTEIN: uncharacterized protein LOC124289014 [Haliotis rubra]
MTDTLNHQTKTRILEELVRNTGANRDFALGLLQENNWQLQDNYKEIEKLCIESVQGARNMQNHPNNRGTPIPVHHMGTTPRSLPGQRGGGAFPPSFTNTGVGRAGGYTVPSNRPGYETMPMQRHTMAHSGFPIVSDDLQQNTRARSQVDPAYRPTERIVPIHVERGPAVKLPAPTIPQSQNRSSEPRPFQHQQYQQQQQQPSPQQHHRVLPNPPPQQGFRPPQFQRDPGPGDHAPLSGGAEGSESHAAAPSSWAADKHKDASNVTPGSKPAGDHTPKLKRGISNIMENVNLVSEARSSVLHDIEEDSHDHMYLLTFLLPDLTVYSEDFRAYLEKDLIETSTLVSLEQAGRLNWWAEMRICQRLLPMATSGDGNCLLHAASLAMWGIHDRQLILRNALYAKMTRGSCKDNLYRRWRWQQTLSNKESGLVLSEEEWQAEWDNLLKLSSPTPRTFPETTKRTSCCDSPVTHGSTSCDPVVYESLEEFHVFVLAHVLQRPIIVVADTVLKDSGGEALAPIPFGGIYLPLECEAKMCYRSPLLLTYDAAHFSALVPMEQEVSPDDKPFLPIAIPLVDPSFQLLPLHFHIDPGPRYDWNKVSSNKKVAELTSEDKLNLLQQFMNVEKLQIPTLDTDYDSDKQSCGSYESDDSVGCVGNKEKKKDAKVSQQMHSVAKQFGSIGKSMGKKIKKNFGNIGKAMKNIGDPDKSSRRQSVGSVITQSTKVIATIATDIGRDRVWCARLSVSRTKMQQELVKNYLHTSEQRFEKDRDLWRKKNEEIRNRVSTHSIASTVTCVTPGCQMFGTAETAYLCSKCYSQQKQEAIDKEKQRGQFVYNTFPGRNKGVEEATIVKLGKSKFYTGVEDYGPEKPALQDSRLSVVANMDRHQSRSVGDVSHMGQHGLHARTPSPDYDNVDYRIADPQHQRRSSSTYITSSQSASRPPTGFNQSAARPPSGLSQSVSRPTSGVSQSGVQVPADLSQSNPRLTTGPAQIGQRQYSSNRCRNDGCDFFGSPELDHYCSGCYKQRQQSMHTQARAQTRL